MATRKPIVAGQFYPRNKSELLDAIKQSFVSKLGTGSLPGKRGSHKIYGAISPHAGYFFSGAGAAWVFNEIGEAHFPDTYVILGVNHSGPRTCSSSEDWETPLGVMKCDTEFVSLLEKKGIPVRNDAHDREHSIEVQLPFLQLVSKDKADAVRIVPIMIADAQFERWGKMIKETASELKRSVVVICSSDFTHYGYDYGYVPFEDNVASNMKKLDLGAVDLIKKLDPEGFLAYTEKTGATICGRFGICVLLWLMKNMLNAKKPELLKYYTSADVLGNYNTAVGYAAIVFR